MRRRVTRNPFKAPATAPTSNVNGAATTTGIPRSRQNAPNRTADRPIKEPTERSMPPPTITGVNATASRPISTLSRRTSKPLPSVKKLVPIAAKTAISAAIRASKIACDGSSRIGAEGGGDDDDAAKSISSPG